MTAPVEPVRGRTGGAGGRVGPELIAGLLVVILILGGVATYAASGPSPDATSESSLPVDSPGPGDSAAESANVEGSGPPSLAPSAPAVAPSGSAGPPIASAGPPVASLSAGPSLPLVQSPWTPTANLLLGADTRLIDRREALREVLSTKPKSAADLAREMRATSAEIQVALGSIRALDAAGAPAGLIDRLMTPHQAAADAALEALGHPIDDVAGYKTASKAVVTSLETLETLMRELAAAAGLPDPFPGLVIPSPKASAAPSAAH